MISQERLKELLIYDERTGIFTWAVDRQKCRRGGVAGCITSRYVDIGVDGKRYRAHRLAWLYVYGYFPERGIDHIDRVRSNNKIGSLRDVSQMCNMRNRKQNTNNTSGVKGIDWHKHSNRWRVQIRINNKKNYVGLSEDFVEAVAMRLAVEQCIGWKSCESSSPAFVYMQNYLSSIRVDTKIA